MKVNIHTEWGELKEIIVGSCFNIAPMNIDLSFKLFFNDNIQDALLKNSIELQKRLVEQRQEDLDQFSKTLEDLGIKVFRPRKLEQVEPFKTPYFEDHTSPVDNPRDQVLIIGDEIIETPCIWRRRFFENDLLKDIFYHYFNEGSLWTSAPRPMMKDESFDLSYVQRNNSKVDFTQYDRLEKKFEIMFDGAQCLKFGKDIIMNISNKNHELGFKWLQNHLKDRFKIHPVKITDHHIDGMFMPLRPGVLLINPKTMADKIHLLPKELQKWDMLMVPEKHKDSAKSDVFLASENINVNVLPLDERRVIIFDETGYDNEKLEEVLVKNGFEPIKIRLRHSRIFGGGAHCATLDTVRDDAPLRYL